MHLINKTQSKEKMFQKPWLAYSLQAMKPVDREQNQWLIEKTTIIENQLKAAYDQLGFQTDFYIIGSVATNTHQVQPFKIDLLVLLKSDSKNETNDELSLLESLMKLYKSSLIVLPPQFPKALINDSQPLALEMSFNSWACTFCLYFGVWQPGKSTASGISSLSGEVKFLHLTQKELIEMDPFQGILKLNLKDQKVNQNAKPLIRMLKKLKHDSKLNIPLSGHEITSIVYSMDDYSLEKQDGQLLFLLLECSLFLKKLEDNLFLRRSLRSPDKLPLQCIHEELRVLTGIKLLKSELDKLIKHLVLEIDLYTNVNEMAVN
jgi:hypothetical protein